MQDQDGIIDKKDAFKYSFQQQILPAWTPVLTMKNTAPLFLSTGVVFIAIGIMLISYSNQIVQFNFEYSKKCSTDQLCMLEFSIKDKIPKPVFFYVELTNFYQNHRLYVSSKSVDQLANLDVSDQTLQGECKHAYTNAEIGKTHSVDGTLLNADAIANPCGLIAKTFLNDTFTPVENNGKNFTIKTENIAWPYDKSTLFKNSDNWKKTQWIDKQDERLMNWMRISALPTFQKLWGTIDQDLEGDYKIQIQNNYPTSMFGGTKSIIFSNANAFGGQNSILAILYIVFGIISILISISFLLKSKNSNQNQLDFN